MSDMVPAKKNPKVYVQVDEDNQPMFWWDENMDKYRPVTLTFLEGQPLTQMMFLYKGEIWRCTGHDVE